MKKLINYLALAILSITPLFAQSPVSITGTVQTNGVGCAGGSGGTNCFVRMTLRNYAGFTPRVVGTGFIVATQYPDIIPDSSGNWGVTVWGNDNIQPNTCNPGGNTACTFYTVEFWYGGKMKSGNNWQFIGAGPFNLNSLAPLTTSIPPPPPFLPVLLNPLGDQIVNRGNVYFQNIGLLGGGFSVGNCLQIGVGGLLVPTTCGGGGSISGLTIGFIPQAGSPTSIVNSSPRLDNGITVPNGLSYFGSGGFSVVSDGVHAGSLQLLGGAAPTLGTNSFGWIGPNSLSFTSYFLQPNTSGPTNSTPFMSCGTPSGNVSACTWVAAQTGLPASPQVGDTLRFNVNGDGLWDAVNMSQPVSTFYPVFGGPPVLTGPMATGNGVLGSQADVNPTATSGVAKTFSSTSTASLNTVIGVKAGENGNNSVFGMMAFYKWTLKLAIGQTTNARYWMGMGCYSNTGTANNTKLILNDLGYAADVPNKTTLGFRYSAGTDTHWQAVSANAGGSQTTTDTGVTPDTNPHIFEMATNVTGTAVNFFIDGTLVATITTNLPVVANGTNSAGDMFWVGDNKNTANVVSGTFYYMMTSHK